MAKLYKKPKFTKYCHGFVHFSLIFEPFVFTTLIDTPRIISFSIFININILAEQYRLDGFEENFHIEPEGNVFSVIDIIL